MLAAPYGPGPAAFAPASAQQSPLYVPAPVSYQTGGPESVAAPNPQSWEPQFLQSVPQPPAQPASLYTPPAPVAGPPPDLERPYFQQDPLLDPANWPHVGWFADVEVDAVQPYIHNDMHDVVTTKGGATIPVGLGSAKLNFNVSPRFEVGYRLPSGFGEIAVADRFLTGGSGAQAFTGPDGAAARSSTLFFNYTDIDYISREYTPLPLWDMKWRAGWRIAESFLTTTVTEPRAEAAAGSGLYFQQMTNRTFATGPHAAVELERTLRWGGFSIMTKVDGAWNFGRVRQTFAADLTSGDGGFLYESVYQEIIMLGVYGGLGWQPASNPNMRGFLGYFDETWWNPMLNRTSGTSYGNFYYQGVALRFSINY